jgi:LacI family transcriptional regulator
MLPDRRETVLVVADDIHAHDEMPSHLLLTHLFYHLSVAGIPYEVMDAMEVDELNTNFYKLLLHLGFRHESIERTKSLRIPVIGVNHELPSSNFVGTDHAEGLRMAVEHLTDSGHETIALILGYRDSWGEKARVEGYKKGLLEAGVEFLPALIQSSEKDGIVTAVGKCLAANPTAMIVSGEHWGPQVFHALSLFNKKIPDDISIVTYENSLFSPYSTPASTTIDQRFSRICAEVVSTVETVFSGTAEFPLRKIIENRLIVRGSVSQKPSPKNAH